MLAKAGHRKRRNQIVLRVYTHTHTLPPIYYTILTTNRKKTNNTNTPSGWSFGVGWLFTQFFVLFFLLRLRLD
jgi:hypothetical protein